MQQDQTNLNKEAHDQPPQDIDTKSKIDKHLSDINDTISEDDLKKINTSTHTGESSAMPEEESSEQNGEEEPHKESPSSWEIMGE